MLSDNHTFKGKRRVGSTDISDFTDYQGLGHDPLYKRFSSVNSVITRAIDPAFAHFLAVPDYSAQNDAVNWYIDEWTEVPQPLTSLSGEARQRYESIKTTTINHWRNALNKLSGEDLQVMACALRYINDDFIFCADNKVYLLAWGMTPDTRKHIATGELLHEAPSLTKHSITFNPGENGTFAVGSNGIVTLPDGSVITSHDLPIIDVEDGYEFTGWTPNPLNVVLDKDLTFTATYKKTSVAPPPMPTPPPLVNVHFNAGQNGFLNGRDTISKPRGSHLTPNEVPAITPKKGFIFKGWSINPLALALTDNIVINAIYEKRPPWYKRLWAWIKEKGCLKWLLLLLGILLLLGLLSWLFPDCVGCSCRHEENGVADIDKIITEKGDTIDNNGRIDPIDLDDGKLPDRDAIVPPVANPGEEPPIVEEPGVPPFIGNRLFIFIEDDNDNVDALAADFKKAYPGDKYQIIGFDREVKTMVIQIPADERVKIQKELPERLKNHEILVIEEEIYYRDNSTYGTGSSTHNTKPGWHIAAVKAPEAWNITKGNPDVTVAVIDDGIDASHPMFANRIVGAYNVYNQNNRLSNGQGHGTHVAALAVGSLQYLNQGAAGIAPNCKLMPVQVFDNGNCPLSALISGIMYAVHKDADVINVSIGPSFKGLNALPVDVQKEIARTRFKKLEKVWNRVCVLASRKRSIIVFAAGNDAILSSIPAENRNDVSITVGAVNQHLYPSEFTNYGECTDITAPGVEIYSAFPVKSFRSMDGTSMAAPIVSGAVALMKSLKRDITSRQARNVLYRTGADVYGPIPPMVQVNLALEGVRKGDFSEPAKRPMRPVPGAGPADPPSWTDGPEPIEGGIPGDDGTIVVIPGDQTIPGNGTAPGEVIGVIPGDGRIPGETPAPGDNVKNPRKQPGDNENDYDEIRRLIKEYQKRIAELEKQLPENKRRK